MMKKSRFNRFRIIKADRFSISKESADLLMEVVAKIIGEKTTSKASRALLLGVATAAIGIVSGDAPAPPMIQDAPQVVVAPRPPEKPPTPEVPVATAPPYPPREGDIQKVNATK